MGANNSIGGENGSELRLKVLPGQHGSFASLKSILTQLKSLANSEQRAEFARIDNYLEDVCPDASTQGNGNYGKLLTDSVAFAILRRISRESVYTARVIDLSARIINTALSHLPSCTRVHVVDVDRIDRLTLKVLARAMLLLEPAHQFAWVWHSASDPTATSDEGGENIFLASRRQLLRQLVGILSPRLEYQSTTSALISDDTQNDEVSTYDISAALVLQNYDACFLWCSAVLRNGCNKEEDEVLRLMALAATNVGRLEEALGFLHAAEAKCVSPSRLGHILYLQGLIEAKRRYDLSSSNAHYQRGLAILDAEKVENAAVRLERAWLFNGLALNEAILWRRSPIRTEHYERAFNLVRNAFDLVRDREDAAATYLKFNLLSNSAFLLEMSGKYDLAIDVLDKVFDFTPEQLRSEYHRLRSNVDYRVGILHYRAGRLEDANRHLQVAAEHDDALQSWYTSERILRALGIVALDLGAVAEATAVFTKGLEMCQKARSAEGAREHARGLIAAHLLSGKQRQAQEVREDLLNEEAMDVVTIASVQSGESVQDVRPNPPSPKLPAYIPEIDLEGIPEIDLNRFLGKALPPTNNQLGPWSN
ncbi:MAG TPA: hypothetical protein VJT15_04720 [Pyrinomonadaceae bacterium]|nr:hypothetical protein [Pyrinomonadaceae bacterium]